jgi:hypothetical protein
MKLRDDLEKHRSVELERRRKVEISRTLRSRGSRLERRIRDSVGAVLNAQIIKRQIVRWNDRTFLVPALVFKKETQTEHP